LGQPITQTILDERHACQYAEGAHPGGLQTANLFAAQEGCCVHMGVRINLEAPSGWVFGTLEAPAMPGAVAATIAREQRASHEPGFQLRWPRGPLA
jgi:hypothetical protein